jgi:hypothetical protein
VPGSETKGEKAAHVAEQKAEGAQLETARAGGELAQRKAAAEQAQAEEDQKRTQAHFDDVDKRTSEGHAYLQAQQEKVAKYKVRDVFEGRPGAAIAAALLEGLGAFGASLSHGPNQASAVFERGRQQFRQQQLDELDGLNKGVVDARDRMELTRMELAAREAGMFKLLATSRAANIARFGGDQAKIDGDKIYNELAGHQAESERTYQSMLHTRGQAEKVQGSEMARNYAAAAKDRAEGAAGGKYNKATDPSLRNVSGPDGKVLFTARDPEQAKAAGDEVANTRDLMAKARQLKKLIDEGPTFFGVGDRPALMDQLHSDLMNVVRVAGKMGTLDKGSVEQLEKMIPNRAGALGTGKVKMDQFIATARAGAIRRFDTYGVEGRKVVDYLERADGGGGGGGADGPAPNRTEYARAMDAYRRAPAGSPDQARLGKTLQGMRAAMGH